MTLLEVLVVMVILGLLATLGSVQLMGTLGRARADTARLQMEELATAIELFRIDTGRLPSTQEGLTALVERPVDLAHWRGPYVKSKASVLDPWKRPFQYKAPGEQREYDLVSLGADGAARGKDENADVTYAAAAQ